MLRGRAVSRESQGLDGAGYSLLRKGGDGVITQGPSPAGRKEKKLLILPLVGTGRAMCRLIRVTGETLHSKARTPLPSLSLTAPRQGQGQRLWARSTLTRLAWCCPQIETQPECPRKFCGVSEEQGSLISHQAGAQSYVRARARQWSGKRRAGSDWCSDFSQEGNLSRDEKPAALGG